MLSKLSFSFTSVEVIRLFLRNISSTANYLIQLFHFIFSFMHFKKRAIYEMWKRRVRACLVPCSQWFSPGKREPNRKIVEPEEVKVLRFFFFNRIFTSFFVLRAINFVKSSHQSRFPVHLISANVTKRMRLCRSELRIFIFFPAATVSSTTGGRSVFVSQE